VHLIRIAILGLVVFVGAAPVSAQSAADEKAIRDIADRFKVAWNTHDMNVLGSITTDDVDFVNVAGLHWKGRDQVVKEHAERHKVRFRNSVWTNKAVRVQLLRPDIALVHIEWETHGDLDFDLKPWPPRKGIFSWVMVKNGADWRIRSVQNTDSTTPPDPGARTRKQRPVQPAAAAGRVVIGHDRLRSSWNR
jgi:uncharacterized protein (TIGR02246 family)